MGMKFEWKVKSKRNFNSIKPYFQNMYLKHRQFHWKIKYSSQWQPLLFRGHLITTWTWGGLGGQNLVHVVFECPLLLRCEIFLMTSLLAKVEEGQFLQLIYLFVNGMYIVHITNIMKNPINIHSYLPNFIRIICSDVYVSLVDFFLFWNYIALSNQNWEQFLVSK